MEGQRIAGPVLFDGDHELGDEGERAEAAGQQAAVTARDACPGDEVEGGRELPGRVALEGHAGKTLDEFGAGELPLEAVREPEVDERAVVPAEMKLEQPDLQGGLGLCADAERRAHGEVGVEQLPGRERDPQGILEPADRTQRGRVVHAHVRPRRDRGVRVGIEQ